MWAKTFVGTLTSKKFQLVFFGMEEQTASNSNPGVAADCKGGVESMTEAGSR